MDTVGESAWKAGIAEAVTGPGTLSDCEIGSLGVAQSVQETAGQYTFNLELLCLQLTALPSCLGSVY